LSSRLGLAFDPVALGLAVIGSLAPDIDHPKSTLGQLVKPLSVPIAFVFGHRGVTHSTLAVIACAWVLYEHAGYSRLILPFLIGYISHLGGDLLTPAGLPLLWPLKRRRTFSLPIMKSGGFSEQCVVVLLAGWMISGLFGCNWPALTFNNSWPIIQQAALPYLGGTLFGPKLGLSAPPHPIRKPPPPERRMAHLSKS
jgi:inner membrane protein